MLITCSNIKKGVLTNLIINLVQFFADHLFQILEKVYLEIFQKRSAIFNLSPFQILKKVYLQTLKKIWPTFFVITFFKYKKNHTYKSKEQTSLLLC